MSQSATSIINNSGLSGGPAPQTLSRSTSIESGLDSSCLPPISLRNDSREIYQHINEKKQELLKALMEQTDPPLSEESALRLTFGNIRLSGTVTGVWASGNLHKFKSNGQPAAKSLTKIFSELKNLVLLAGEECDLGTPIFPGWKPKENGIQEGGKGTSGNGTPLTVLKLSKGKQRGRDELAGHGNCEVSRKKLRTAALSQNNGNSRLSSTSRGSGDSSRNRASPPLPSAASRPLDPHRDTWKPPATRGPTTNTIALKAHPLSRSPEPTDSLHSALTAPVSVMHLVIRQVKAQICKFMVLNSSGNWLSDELKDRIKSVADILAKNTYSILNHPLHKDKDQSGLLFDINSLLSALLVLSKTRTDKTGVEVITDAINKLSKMLCDIAASPQRVPNAKSNP